MGRDIIFHLTLGLDICYNIYVQERERKEMSYEEDFQKQFQNQVQRIADTLEEIKDYDFYEQVDEETDEEGNWYFEDTYNTDYIWRLGYGLMGVRIMIACGGPNIWVDTFEKTVHGYWGGDEAIAYLSDDCCAKIEDAFGADAAEQIYLDRN